MIHNLRVQTIDDKSVQERELYKRELTLASAILDAYKAVTSKDAADVERFQERFRGGDGAAGAGSVASGSAGSAGNLKSAPPTGSIAQLKHVSYIDSYPPSIETRVGSKAEYSVLKKNLTQDLAP